jgi:translation initiation factor 5B
MSKKNKVEQIDCKTRSPICSTLGHVDHGKSSILDTIRGSNIIAKEAGAITQAIGASIVPMATIEKVCGNLLKASNINFTIPGILFIDTPGHAAFTSLRKRGGSISDIAILVVDINEGFKPQTIEAVEILKKSKTPFVVAANKIDILPGFNDQKGMLMQNIMAQNPDVQYKIDNQIYEVVGKLSELGIQSERFDRIQDYTQQIAIVPCSAKARIGIPELLMVLAGLAQKFLEKCLECNICSPARATILEVKEEKGLGKTLDLIVYDGILNTNDILVIGNMGEPIITKVKALLVPAPLAEMRDKKTKFTSVKSVTAAMGIKVSAQNLDNVIAGMPVRVSPPNMLEQVKREIMEEVEEVFIGIDEEGLVIKADSLGSLEALTTLLKEKEIPIKRARIGNISKKDILEAEANIEKEPYLAAILGFNIEDRSEIKQDHVKIITSDVIYHILDSYESWKEEKRKEEEEKELKGMQKPFKIKILEGYIFRQSNPAVVGVEVLEGEMHSNSSVMNKDGTELTRVKGLQENKKNVDKAERGKQVATSMDHVTIGRQIHENDILYSVITEDEFRRYKELKRLLTPEQKELLKEIGEIKRRDNPVWGV